MADVAEESMKAAVERVIESPHHATSGEVRVPYLKKSLFLYLPYTGLQVMHVTILRQMHTTQWYLVWLEGMHISSKFPCLSVNRPFQYT